MLVLALLMSVSLLYQQHPLMDDGGNCCLELDLSFKIVWGFLLLAERWMPLAAPVPGVWLLLQRETTHGSDPLLRST